MSKQIEDLKQLLTDSGFTHANLGKLEQYSGLVTAEIAKKLLEFNTKNRKLIRQNETKLTNDMSKSIYHLTGIPIIFSNVRLLDGRHRLQSIVNSGAPQYMPIVFGVSNAAWSAIDVGSPRTLKNSLEYHGFNVTGYESDAIYVAYKLSLNKASKYGDKENFGIVVDFFKENRVEFMKSMDFIKSLDTNGTVFSKSCLLSLHYMFKKKHIDHANAIIKKAGTGMGLSAGDNIKKLIDYINNIKDAAGFVNTRKQIAWMIRVWNYDMEDKALNKFMGVVKNEVPLQENSIKFRKW